MKKAFLILMIFPIHLFGQGMEEGGAVKDSTTNVEDKISMSQLTEIEDSKKKTEEELKSANKRILKQDSIIKEGLTKISRMKVQLSNLKADSLNFQNTIGGLRKQLLKTDTCLINVASNFLYIPYEAYSVKEIAIPAFEMVYDKTLREKYKSRYALLVNYKDDIVDLISFLEEQKKDLSNRFAKNANDAINTLHTKRFYMTYHAFEDWKSTFLGGKIADVEKQLKLFNGSTHKVNFDKIIGELQECLNTENNL